MKISKSIRLFLEHCEFEKSLSNYTLLFYKIDLYQFAKFLEEKGINEIQNADKTIIKNYVQNLSKFEPSTIKRKIASTKSFLSFLEFEDFILVNPYRKIKLRIKEPKQLPVVLELEEVKRLLQIVKNASDKVENKQSQCYGEKLRDMTIIEILFATGVRVSELCGLSIEHVNLKTGRLLINGKGKKQRVVQICNSETLAVLNNYFSFYEESIESVGFFLSAA